MSNLYRQDREKQMNNKIHGMASFQRGNEFYKTSAPMQTENILKKEAVHHSDIQLLAYKIHCEKAGTAFANWLEAERILQYSHRK